MVLLSHPTGNANVRQALLALYERDMLTAFYTTVAWQQRSVWNNALPASLRKELSRRSYSGIPERFIHTSPMRELCRVVASRCGLRSLVANTNAPLSAAAIYRHADRQAARAVSRLAPEAVYAYDGGALETFRAARRMGVKTIYELPIADARYRQEFFREEMELQPDFAGILQEARDDAAWLAQKDEELALADRVIVPSHYVQSTLPASVSEKIVRVVPYGAPPVPPHQQPRGRRDGKLRVLYVGSLSQRKGISYLLGAIEKIGTAVEFTIIGSRVGHCAPLDAALQKYKWMPSLPHSAVLEVMDQNDVLLLPTLSEGFALVTLEAMSRGMVVVTTPNSGVLGTIRDGMDGFIVPIRSSVALVKRLELLMSDRDLLATMSASALQRAGECSWEKYRTSLAEVVNEVVASREACSCV